MFGALVQTANERFSAVEGDQVFFVLKTLLSQMPSKGHGTAVAPVISLIWAEHRPVS